jgi:FixJ family two-component response regulator
MNKLSLISVVDDDESVRESLPDLLREFGFAVQTFESGEQFFASASMEQSQCLILDIAMPGMSGFDVQRGLRARNNHVPIVFITAQREKNAHRYSTEDGVVACLLKPFSDIALLEAIRFAMGTN